MENNKNTWMIDVAYTKGNDYLINHISVKASDKQEAWREYDKIQAKEKLKGWEITPCSGKWHIT
jgi:hypothetical protein